MRIIRNTRHQVTDFGRRPIDTRPTGKINNVEVYPIGGQFTIGVVTKKPTITNEYYNQYIVL